MWLRCVAKNGLINTAPKKSSLTISHGKSWELQA